MKTTIVFAVLVFLSCGTVLGANAHTLRDLRHLNNLLAEKSDFIPAKLVAKSLRELSEVNI